MKRNLILQTDSYKIGHWAMLPPGTTHVSSYLEARRGAAHAATVFFSLQYLLKEYLEGVRVTHDDVFEALSFCKYHFGEESFLNEDGWHHIAERHGGRLPLHIRAVPEGSVVPVGNVLMTVENTDPKVPWLTNAVESLLLKVWYGTTVATKSFFMRKELANRCNSWEDTAYMLHDFGYRGVSSEESAAVGAAAHLLSFMGTDTIMGMEFLRQYYGASLDNLAHSVAASEHSIMTSEGKEGEHGRAKDILRTYEGKIVSLVADSYDYYAFVKRMIKEHYFVNHLKCQLVIRPDSVTKDHPTPKELVRWTLEELLQLPYTKDERGLIRTAYKVLWGDGLDDAGILEIVDYIQSYNFAPQNIATFGMGGGMLQKVNRDTERFAFKCSAIKIGEEWRDVQKSPLDQSKASKPGRLSLNIHPNGDLETVPLFHEGWDHQNDLLRTVFLNGVVTRQYTFDDINLRKG